MICDRSDFRLNIASNLGFEVCNTKTEDFLQKASFYFGFARLLTGKTADIDIILDAAGAEAIINIFMEHGKIESRFVSVAVNKALRQLDLLHMTYAQKSIIGSGGYMPEDVKEEFSLFDPKFLEEVANMKEKNLAVEVLKKLIAEQVIVYKRTNIVKSEKFSEIMQKCVNAYLNGMLTNEEVIEEMLNLAKQIAEAQKEGEKLGLTADELAFYDALTKPQTIKDFYENEELIAITKELADTLRKNRTIDWQKRNSARAKMRMMIKKLLKNINIRRREWTMPFKQL